MNAKLFLNSIKTLPYALLALGLFSLTAPKVHADTTYSYTGNPYSLALAPWTTSMFMSGFFVLPSPLPANLAFGFITPTSFSFFDGVQTITQSSASTSLFQVGTDATGQINQWNILMQGLSGQIETLTTFDQATGRFGIPPTAGIARSNSRGTLGIANGRSSRERQWCSAASSVAYRVGRSDPPLQTRLGLGGGR